MAPELEALRAELQGRIVVPGDEDYDDLRVVAAPVDRRPAAIARPRDASDVARSVLFARESGMPLAVRSGGHSGAGHGVVDAGLVIDLRDMRSLEIDASARTASAETGL